MLGRALHAGLAFQRIPDEKLTKLFKKLFKKCYVLHSSFVYSQCTLILVIGITDIAAAVITEH